MELYMVNQKEENIREERETDRNWQLLCSDIEEASTLTSMRRHLATKRQKNIVFSLLAKEVSKFMTK